MDDPAFEALEDREVIRPLLEALPERERRIIMLRFFRNKSQSQIAEGTGHLPDARVATARPHSGAAPGRAVRRLTKRRATARRLGSPQA